MVYWNVLRSTIYTEDFPKENEGFMTEKDHTGENESIGKSHKKWGFINGLFCLKRSKQIHTNIKN